MSKSNMDAIKPRPKPKVNSGEIGGALTEALGGDQRQGRGL